MCPKMHWPIASLNMLSMVMTSETCHEPRGRLKDLQPTQQNKRERVAVKSENLTKKGMCTYRWTPLGVTPFSLLFLATGARSINICCYFVHTRRTQDAQGRSKDFHSGMGPCRIHSFALRHQVCVHSRKYQSQSAVGLWQHAIFHQKSKQSYVAPINMDDMSMTLSVVQLLSGLSNAVAALNVPDIVSTLDVCHEFTSAHGTPWKNHANHHR